MPQFFRKPSLRTRVSGAALLVCALVLPETRVLRAQPPPTPARPTILPATAPTTPIAPPTPAGLPQTQTAPAASVYVASEAHPARRPVIEYAQGELVVNAENSSLNEILRAISRQTGMKITGGVAEERVFGTYGPDRAQAVLTRLLDGTGANVLIFENADETVRELVLSTRTGAASPPNPDALRSSPPETDLPPQVVRHPERGNRNLQDRAEQERLLESQAPNQTSTPDRQTPSGLTTEQSPNGVKTPQQLYNDLSTRQQQPGESIPQGAGTPAPQ